MRRPASNRQRNKISRALWNRLIRLAPPSVNVRDASIGNYDVNRFSIRAESKNAEDVKTLYERFIQSLRDSNWEFRPNDWLLGLAHPEVSRAEAYVSEPKSFDDRNYFDISISMWEVT